MTFTEAAVEVLRRAGKPLHYAEIAVISVRENLLSHVGQDPEVTMGQRLAAMAKREDERKVVAIAPEGTFALTEWNVPAEVVIEAMPPPTVPEESKEPPYRAREREPRPIHAQARRRMEVLQAEHEEGSEEVEAERRRAQKGQRRYPPPAEVLFDALAQKQSGAPLAELAADLLKRNLLSDALVHDLPSLVQALLEDNRRRTEAGRKPAFIVDGERVTLVEFPQPVAAGEVAAEAARTPQTSLGRPLTGAQLAAEGRRAVVRALRRRVAELETAGFEHLCALLLERMGMRDVRVAKRSKEGPLYLARQRRGVSDLRVAVKLVRGSREISRQDVQELRKDLAHYSAQMGLVLAAGEAGREAKSEASAAGEPPVALYAGDSLPEELIALRVGVTVELVELADVDEAFFAAAVKAAPHGREERVREDQRRDSRPEQKQREGAELPQAREPRDPSGAEENGQAAEVPAHEVELVPETAQAQAQAQAAAPSEATAATSDAPAAEPLAEAGLDAAPAAAAAEPARGGRGRGRRDREEKPRANTPAEQAWGQPAGTPRRSAGSSAPIAMDRSGEEPRPPAVAEEEAGPSAAPEPGEAAEKPELTEAGPDAGGPAKDGTETLPASSEQGARAAAGPGTPDRG